MSDTPADVNTPLVEGLDYYLENGLFVFTAAYHLKRGYCCHSGCRHCPFGDPASETDSPAEMPEPPAKPDDHR